MAYIFSYISLPISETDLVDCPRARVPAGVEVEHGAGLAPDAEARLPVVRADLPLPVDHLLAVLGRHLLAVAVLDDTENCGYSDTGLIELQSYNRLR